MSKGVHRYYCFSRITLNALKWKTSLENNELCLELTLIVVLRMDSNSYPHCQDLGSNTQSQIIAPSDYNDKTLPEAQRTHGLTP